MAQNAIGKCKNICNDSVFVATMIVVIYTIIVGLGFAKDMNLIYFFSIENCNFQTFISVATLKKHNNIFYTFTNRNNIYPQNPTAQSSITT